MLAACVYRGVADREVPNTGQEGEVEQLGELGADLAGVGVDRIAAGQHEIEPCSLLRGLVLERGRERLGRRECVGSCERDVGDVHAVDVHVLVEAPRDRLAQRVVGRGRAQREHRDA